MPRIASIILTASLLLLSAAALAEDPLLHFERIHTRIVDETDNRMSLKVFPDGRAYATFPSYMKSAGRHEFQLSEAELSEIAAMVETLGTFSQAGLDEERTSAFSSRSDGIAHDISDPDTVAFSIHKTGRDQHTLVAPSPDLFQDRGRTSSQLGQLAEMEQRLRKLMRNAAGRSK